MFEKKVKEEKNPWLEPAAIRLTFERLQESAGGQDVFFLHFSSIYIHRNYLWVTHYLQVPQMEPNGHHLNMIYTLKYIPRLLGSGFEKFGMLHLSWPPLLHTKFPWNLWMHWALQAAIRKLILFLNLAKMPCNWESHLLARQTHNHSSKLIMLDGDGLR